MKKLLLLIAAPSIILFIVIIAAVGAGSPAATIPVEPVATEEKAAEYATMASKMVAPWEIVILTDAIEAEANKKGDIEDVNPMYTTLEFLFLDVVVEQYEVVEWKEDEEGNKSAVYDWVYKRTERYTAKNEILGYIGIADQALADFSPEKLIDRTQKIATDNSDSDVRYSIDFSANSDFEAVLKDFIKMDKSDIAKVIELYNSNYLETWLSEEVLAKIDDIKAMYGMYQFVDFDGYESYTGLVFTDGETSVVYFSQLDARWKDEPYGLTGTIGQSACGPSSMSIVISSLTDQTVDPVYMAAWAYAHGYRAEGNGSYHSLIPGAARAFGLNVTGCTAADGQDILDALANGKLVVALMSKGHFTSGGHYIVLRGVTSDGKILVADPASYARSQQKWDFSIILNEARKGAGAGGPFWIIG